MKIEIKTITPEYASELLKKNAFNRNLNKSTVDYYASQIIRGQWQLNGDSIKIAKNGNLLDGQHRLFAIIKSNTPIDAVICYDVDNSAFDTIDQGKTRTGGDILGILSVKNATTVSGIIGKYFLLSNGNQMYEKVTANKMLKFSKRDIVNEFSENEKLYTEIAIFSRKLCKNKKLMNASAIGGYIAFLIKDKKHSFELVGNFFNQLFTGENIENNTIRVLREKIIDASLKGYKMTDSLKYELIVKTWNAYVSGKEYKQLQIFESERPLKFL